MLDQTPIATLPPRPHDGHKGAFGRVAVLGGCAGSVVLDGQAGGGLGDAMMLGAPALAATAAARAGAGLVRVACPAPIAAAVLTLCPQATAVAMPVDDAGSIEAHEAAAVLDELCSQWADALVLGCGLGVEPGGAWQVVYRAVRHVEVPVVLDADGLTHLAGMKVSAQELSAPLVLTPHVGEFERLAGAMGLRLDARSAAGRPEAAQRLAQALGCVVVLKGAGTIVTDGQRVWRCGRGHACLATGGTGDVLAGLIGGLIAQARAAMPAAGPIGTAARVPDLYELCRAGVEAHAAAGEMWATQRGASAGLDPRELCELIPACLEPLRDGR